MRNYSSEIIHETIVRDIVDILTNGGDVADTMLKKWAGSRYSYSSASKASANLTLVFPVIAEESVSVDTARMVTKAIERKAAAMMQMLFSAINITNSEDAIDYIKSVHNNIDIDDNIKVDDYLGAMKDIAARESVEIADPEKYESVMKDMKNLNFYLEEGPANPPIGSYVIDKNQKKVVLEWDHLLGGEEPSDSADFYKKQQIETDVKKANELVPTLMTIKFHKMVDGTPIQSTAVIGIKAKLQYVSRQDMMNRIVIKNKDKNGLFNFLRATTREISFWKDFVFAIDRAKIDAISTSGRGSSDPVWKLLEFRAIKSRLKRTMGFNNDDGAITTLVISDETAKELDREDGINPYIARIIKPVMDAYNIMSFVIVNEASEKASFIFDDGSGRYEIMSFNHLEREERSEFKKIINLIAAAR